MASERAFQPMFFAVSALIFIASATMTIVWGMSMSAMGGMPMPGGWTVFGMAAFALGVALAAAEMQLPALARAVPIAVGAVVLIAGALQFTAWKAHHLACCRKAPELRPPCARSRTTHGVARTQQ